MIRRERRNGREARGKKEWEKRGGRSREKIEKERKGRDKRELRRQFEEEGLKEINKFTWTSSTRKSQEHFMMKLFIASLKYNFMIKY